MDQVPSLGHVSSEAAKRLVVLSGIKSTCTREDIEKIAGNSKRIRQVRYPVSLQDGSQGNCAAVLYCGKRDALKAVRRLNSQTIDGLKITAAMYGSEQVKAEVKVVNAKKGRLIIRNLSFKCEANNLREVFSQFGDISDVNIPLREDGKKKGFGVVQFSSMAQAAKAIKHLNGSMLLGRPIAVDWAMAKDRYMKAIATEEDNSEQQVQIAGNEEDNSTMDVDDNSQADDSDSSVADDSDGDESSGSDNDDGNDDVSEDEEDDESDAESDSDASETDASPKKRKKMSQSNKSEKMAARKTDVDQGLTVFVRNLSYDSMEEDLEELMSQFGDIVYCRLVVDPETEHPKGTAFVKFKSKDAVEKCLQSSDPSSSESNELTLDGRKLSVSLALPRDKVQQMAKEKSAKDKKGDQRNLHLIRESLIRPGTKAAEGMSKSDLAKRQKIESITRQKIKNPNIFVSSTRLCVRNIPTSVDDRALKKIFLKYSSNPSAKITECRIMRDLNRIASTSKLGKSRGYAFVNFAEHSDALRALKNTNNNPDIFGENKRLIVEFSLENRTALVAKEKRTERAMVKNKFLGSSTDAAAERPVLKASKVKPTSIIAPCSSAKPKVKGAAVLPSHSGPKIRHKKRVPPAPAVNADKKSTSKKQKKKEAKKYKAKRKSVEIRDDVDQLVAKYRQKITSAMSSASKSKWATF